MSRTHRGITLGDVASSANVHISTASRVLSGRPVQVRDQTRKRILEAAVRLGFINHATQGLPASHQTIVLAARYDVSWDDTIYAEMPDDLGRACDSIGRDLVMRWCDTPQDLDPARLADFGQAVVVHQSLATILPEDLLPPFPVVTLNWPVEDPHRDSIQPDESIGLSELSDHLIRQGHRRIALIIDSNAAHRRSATIRREVLRHRFGDGMVELAADVGSIRNQLTGASAPTALIAYSGRIELPIAFSAARELGLSIPRDLSIACADRTPWCDVVRTDCTCIRIPMRAMCERAIEQIQRRLSSPREAPVHHEIPTEFVPGATCASPRNGF